MQQYKYLAVTLLTIILIAFTCDERSPVTPQWSVGNPDVFWTHILCGQITASRQVQGFHSETPTSTHYECVDTDNSCEYYANGNGDCPDVWIYDDNRRDWYPKPGGSAVFAHEISATDLIDYIRKTADECGKTTSFCATGCTNRQYAVEFNIYFEMVDRGVLTAYPKTICTTNVCKNPASCRNMD